MCRTNSVFELERTTTRIQNVYTGTYRYSYCTCMYKYLYCTSTIYLYLYLYEYEYWTHMRAGKIFIHCIDFLIGKHSTSFFSFFSQSPTQLQTNSVPQNVLVSRYRIKALKNSFNFSSSTNCSYDSHSTNK